MISQILRGKVLDLDLAMVRDLQLQVSEPLMFTDERIYLNCTACCGYVENARLFL